MQVGWTWGGREYTFEQARALALLGLAPVPVEFMDAMQSNSHHDSTTPSASVMGSCLRRFNLQRQHDYYEPLEGSLPAFFGTAVHALLAAAKAPQVFGEQRLTHRFSFPDLPAPYDELDFGGSPDHIDPEWDEGAGVVRDYKSKIFVPASQYLTKPNEIQLNIYNVLWTRAGKRGLRDWEVVYFDQKSLPKWFRGTLNDPVKVGRWLEKTLHRWAADTAANILPDPLPEFYKEDPKYGGPVSPCKYCPVRRHCIAALEVETEEYGIPEAHGTNGATAVVGSATGVPGDVPDNDQRGEQDAGVGVPANGVLGGNARLDDTVDAPSHGGDSAAGEPPREVSPAD